MRGKRFTEEQIIAMLKEAETGAKTHLFGYSAADSSHIGSCICIGQGWAR
jgi:hypothetical protein